MTTSVPFEDKSEFKCRSLALSSITAATLEFGFDFELEKDFRAERCWDALKSKIIDLNSSIMKWIRSSFAESMALMVALVGEVRQNA